MNGESLNSSDQQVESWQRYSRLIWQNTQILSDSQKQRLTAASLESNLTMQQPHAVGEVNAQNEKLAGSYEELIVESQNCQELPELTPDGYVVTNSKAIVVAADQTARKLLNCSLKQLLGQPLMAFLIGDLCQCNTILEQLQTNQHQVWEVQIQPRKLASFNAVLRVAAVRDFHGEAIALHWLLQDISQVQHSKREQQVAQRTRELEMTQRQQLEATLQQQSWARLMMAMQARIGQRSKLEELLNATVAEVREFLRADRVVVYKLEPNGMTNAIAESVDAAYISIVGLKMNALLLQPEVVSYCQGNPNIIHNTQLVDSTASTQLLQQQVKTSLTVPILLYEGESNAIAPPLLWGLLAIHQCQEVRFWQPNEVELLQQLATQTSVAIRQLQLYQQVLQLTTDLESQVQKRTAQLQKFLDFEATLKRISDDVRDTLDEKQILQTVVWELAVVLNIHGCNTGLYDAQLTTSTISYEYTQGLDAMQGQVIQMQDFFEGYQQLLQGQHFQFCELGSQWRAPVAILACPICDDRGTIGDLWLFKPAKVAFDNLEIRLVQQVANQCAIAIRQARLFQAAQAKIQELETLNRLKDDFLDTVSHELRTPLANMKMAIQMLGTILLRDRSALPQLTQLEVASSKANRYLQILDRECDRELNSIENLLNLQISGNAQPSVLSAIQLQDWLPQFAEPFQERSDNQKQNLVLDIPSDLPRLICEPSSLSRILAELLNNACKYTPAGEKILVTAKVLRARNAATLPMMQIDVSNWGVEIPASEIPRIFEKFYRIRAHDLWNQGGTGLGLALVEQLVTRLGGEIAVESSDKRTCFTVKLPLS